MTSWSQMPEKLMPSRRSRSRFSIHDLRTYRQLVSVDCKVPKMAAISTFFFSDASVSSGRMMTSDRLQADWLGSAISAQGLQPNS